MVKSKVKKSGVKGELLRKKKTLRKLRTLNFKHFSQEESPILFSEEHLIRRILTIDKILLQETYRYWLAK